MVFTCGQPQRDSHTVTVLCGGIADVGAGARCAIGSVVASQRLRHALTCCSQSALVVAQAQSTQTQNAVSSSGTRLRVKDMREM